VLQSGQDLQNLGASLAKGKQRALPASGITVQIYRSVE